MPKGIGQRSIGGRAGVARRPIGSRYAIPAPGILAVVDSAASGTSPYTATADCWVDIFAQGAGASGAMHNGSTAGGGGGGAAGFKRFRLTKGQQIAFSAGAGGAGQAVDNSSGNDGADTTVTLPTAVALTVGGGKGGTTSVGGAAGAPGGNWDASRSGGGGGDPGASGGNATGGGSGGSGASSGGTLGGGGASAGFSDLYPGALLGANGGTANTGTALTGNGNGSGASAGATAAGRAGRVVLYVTSAPT